jgi:mannose-1-phosphate guanylyltransferase/mannose-6-phosphate isomerase
MIIPVILSGGAGTRLWPLSRKAYPKQFLELIDDENLFKKTLSRVVEKDGFSAPIIVCNKDHRFLIAENLEEEGVKPKSIILEPDGRNTAPAITIASIEAMKNNVGFSDEKGDREDNVLLIMPSDHLIKDVDGFLEAVKKGEKIAKDGYFVTFGIVPDHAETGYGYIEKGAELNHSAFHIKRFTEKPDKETAEKFVNSGDFFWNSGMFMFKASEYLRAVKEFEDGMFESCSLSYKNAVKDLDFVRLEEESFKKCNDISIDYAVMERVKDIAVIPINVGWDDIGSWSSVANNCGEVCGKDEDGNVKDGDVITYNTRDCYVRSEKGLVATVGVKNLIVVNLKDVTLVADINNVQDVKKVVDILKKAGRTEYIFHSRVYRPWGSYETMDEMEGFKVKRLSVRVGAKLSLQKHSRRSEHWVVVKGVANVVLGDEEVVLGEDESIYIPKGVKHRLANFGDEPLEVVEVQAGDYLGEDDIERFEDDYGRSSEKK